MLAIALANQPSASFGRFSRAVAPISRGSTPMQRDTGSLRSEVLGGGSILTGLVLGAIGVFVIEKRFVEASAFALSGAVLTFFVFMHGESVGLAVTPTVAIAYTIIAVFLFALSRSAILSAIEPSEQKAVAATPAVTASPQLLSPAQTGDHGNS
jgi:hypothetical protein